MWLPSAPRHCAFLGDAMEDSGVTSSLWAVAADLLGCYLQPLLLIQNLPIRVGRVNCIMALGFSGRKERKRIAADSPWHNVLPESPWDKGMQCNSPSERAVLGQRDPERRNSTG